MFMSNVESVAVKWAVGIVVFFLFFGATALPLLLTLNQKRVKSLIQIVSTTLKKAEKRSLFKNLTKEQRQLACAQVMSWCAPILAIPLVQKDKKSTYHTLLDEVLQYAFA